MKNVFILIGGANSGKTTIIKNMFKSMYLKIDNFLLAKRDSSPQELSKFCNFEEVIPKVKKIIKFTENKAKKEGIDNFGALIPFTLRINNKQLGINCITKPLEYLKSLSGYNIYLIHLDRNRNKLSGVNSFIKNKLNIALILNSNMQDKQEENTKKLKEFITSKFKNGFII